MARHVSIDIVADSASVERAFKRASVSASGFSRSTNIVEKDFSRMSRGILSGSGVFQHLGRSLAFASGGFLAFGTASEAIRTSIDAAETSEKALKSLGAQAKASGASVKTVFADIGKLTGQGLQLGFNKAELEQGFTILLRGSGSARKALTEMAAAEDVARAKGFSLTEASLLVNRALIGTGNSARALGVHFPKAATAAQKLQIILQRFAGQAKANTTESDKFNATLFNTENIIGTAILPTFNKFLTSFGNYLIKLDQSGRLQRDVNTVLKDAADVFGALKAAMRPVEETFSTLKTITGSTQHAIEALGAAFVILKARAAAIRWGLIDAGIVGVGGAATTATGEVAGLSGALTRLKNLGPIALAIGLEFIPRSTKTIPNGLQGTSFGKFLSSLPVFGGLNSQILHAGDVIDQKLGLLPSTGGKTGQQVINDAAAAGIDIKTGFRVGSRDDIISRRRLGLPVPKSTKTQPPPHVAKSISLLGQFNLEELKLADAQIAGNKAAQKQILQSEESILLKLRDQAKTLKTRTQFAQQAASIEDQLRSLDAAQSKKKKATVATDTLLAKARLDLSDGEKSAARHLLLLDKQRLQDLLDQAKTAAARVSIERQLTTVNKLLKGKSTQAGQFSVPLQLQVDEARLTALGKPIVTILNKIKARAEQALKSGKLGLQGQLDAWNEIASINDQLKNATDGALGKFRQVNVDAIAKSVGLTGDAAKKLKAQLSQIGPGGTVPSTGVGAFGAVIGPNGGDIVVHTHVNLDGKKVAVNTTRHQQKRRTRNPTQTRGAFAGGL